MYPCKTIRSSAAASSLENSETNRCIVCHPAVAATLFARTEQGLPAHDDIASHFMGIRNDGATRSEWEGYCVP